MKRARMSAVLFVAQLSAVCASTQLPPKPLPPPISFGALTRDAVSVESSDQLREMVVRWSRPIAGSRGDTRGLTADRLSVIQEQRGLGSLRRERNPQITEDQLVLVQRNDAGAVLDWRLVRNPRLIRAELPGPDGTLTGRVVERDSAEMLITLPDVPLATRLSVYQPRWNGTEFLLDLVGEVPLTKIR